MNTPGKFVALLLPFIILALGGCSGITKSDTPAMKTWWLEPYEESMPAEAVIPLRLLDISVTVVPGLDTNRILTLSDNAELNHYRSARWAEDLPELVASLTGRSLASSGRFAVVSTSAAGGQDRCELRLEIREFFAKLETTGQTSGVRLEIQGHYQCKSAKAILLQLKATEQVHVERMSVIVAAFQQAMDSVMKDMLKMLP